MDLSHRFIDTVTYSTGLTYTDGDFTASAQATADGRWEEFHRTITTAGGEEKTTTHKFASTTSIPLQAFVWGPDADTGDQGDALRVLQRKFARLLDGSYSYYIHYVGR